VQSVLDEREDAPIETYVAAMEKRKEMYGSFPLDTGITTESNRSNTSASSLNTGTYFLQNVDKMGRRQYARAFSTDVAKVGRLARKVLTKGR